MRWIEEKYGCTREQLLAWIDSKIAKAGGEPLPESIKEILARGDIPTHEERCRAYNCPIDTPPKTVYFAKPKEKPKE